VTVLLPLRGRSEGPAVAVSWGSGTMPAQLGASRGKAASRLADVQLAAQNGMAFRRVSK